MTAAALDSGQVTLDLWLIAVSPAAVLLAPGRDGHGGRWLPRSLVAIEREAPPPAAVRVTLARALAREKRLIEAPGAGQGEMFGEDSAGGGHERET